MYRAFDKSFSMGTVSVQVGALSYLTLTAGTDPEIFQRGIEEANFERKMFVDTGINACTHINMKLFLSFSFSTGLSSIFCFVLLLSFIILKYEGGGGVATPVTPPPL